MTTPPLDGLHHVTLTVSDLDRALAWYARVLGFEPGPRVVVDGREKAMLTRGDLTVTFIHHGDAALPGGFDERRCGLDHLALAVADRDMLAQWVAHLDAAGVRHDGVVDGMRGALVAFRDPDNIALELYTRA